MNIYLFKSFVFTDLVKEGGLIGLKLSDLLFIKKIMNGNVLMDEPIIIVL